MFVSKDVLLIRVENIIIFYNVKTQKEDIVVIGGNKSSPAGGDGFPLDGIGCVNCCGTDLFAIGELKPQAKVAIYQYPGLKLLTTLIGE